MTEQYVRTSPLICCVNYWTGFYIIGTSNMKELTAIMQNGGLDYSVSFILQSFAKTRKNSDKEITNVRSTYQRCSTKKLFLKTKVCNFIKNQTLADWFSNVRISRRAPLKLIPSHVVSFCRKSIVLNNLRRNCFSNYNGWWLCYKDFFQHSVKVSVTGKWVKVCPLKSCLHAPWKISESKEANVRKCSMEWKVEYPNWKGCHSVFL